MQKVWLEEYLQCWNATEAARRAGYAHPNVSGPTNKKTMADAIAERLEEKAMSADEVLLRLAEQARAEQTAYIRADGTVDLNGLLAADKGHLIAGIKWDRNDNRIVEFHNAQKALELIGRHHGLFKDSGTTVNVEVEIAVDDLNAAARQAQEAEEERIRGDSG